MLRTARALLPALLLPLLVSCGGDTGGGSGSDDPQAVVTPTGSPFSVTIDGPETASPGETVKATLENTGRLPDAYRLQADPFTSATIPDPEVQLGPGESATIDIQVLQVPLLVRVQSISAGQGGSEGTLSIGAVGQ